MCPARVWSHVQLGMVRQVVQARPSESLNALAAELSTKLGLHLTARALDGLCRRHGIARDVQVKHASRYSVDELHLLGRLVDQQPRLTLSELVEAMTLATGRRWYRMTVCRARRRLQEDRP